MSTATKNRKRKTNDFDRWYEEFQADRDAPKVAVLITRRGKPLMILETRYSPRYAQIFAKEYNHLSHGELRQQGLKAVPIPVGIEGLEYERKASS
jgi:hypothetical protein